MNILIYVITIVMMLTTIAYAKLEMFRSSIGYQAIFREAIETKERANISQLGYEMYGAITLRKNITSSPASEDKEQKPEDKEQKLKGRVVANPRINFNLLLNRMERENHPKEYALTRSLIKELISELTKGDREINRRLEVRPSLIDDLLNEIEIAAEFLPKKVKITTPEALTKLEFRDSSLKEVFYLILNGRVQHETPKVVENMVQEQIIADDLLEDNDEEINAKAESLESIAPSGVESIINYTTIDKKTQRIRVYLAKPAVLKAIFKKDEIVQKIIESRQNLFKQIRRKNNDLSKEQATQQFEETYLSLVPDLKDVLDFTVSNTNPNKTLGQKNENISRRGRSTAKKG